MPAADALDLKQELLGLYKATSKPKVVTVPALTFLSVDGAGDPNTSADFADAMAALYAVSYGLKFTIKRRTPSLDYKVMPLEGLWWADDPAAFIKGTRDNWRWTAMILQPAVVTAPLVTEAIAAAARKRSSAALERLRFEPFAEGMAAQLLHTGPYAGEGPNIERLHQFIFEQGGQLTGMHHEIYLGDPRRAKPEKLRTILRQPYVLEK